MLKDFFYLLPFWLKTPKNEFIYSFFTAPNVLKTCDLFTIFYTWCKFCMNIYLIDKP